MPKRAALHEMLKKRLPLLTLTVAHGFVDFYIYIPAVLAPGIAQYLGIPLGDVVFVAGAASLTNNVVQLPAGYAIGKRNTAWTLWLSVLLASFSTFVGFASGMASFVVLVMLGAIGTGAFHPEAALSAHDEAGQDSNMGIPVFIAGGAAIAAVSTPMSIKWSGWLGFPALAWFALPGSLAALALLLQYRPRKRGSPTGVLKPRSLRIGKAHAGRLSFWPLLAVAICLSIANGVFIYTLSSHYELIFGSGARIWSGWILMLCGMVGLLVSFVWTALAGKYGFFRVVLASQAAAAPLLLLLAWPASPASGFLIAVPLAFISPSSIFPVVIAMSRNAAGLTQGLRTGIVIGGTSGLSSIVVMTAGRLLRAGMPSSYLLMGCAACCLAATLLAGWQILAGKGGLGGKAAGGDQETS
ncbi:MAG: MFS transporter [Planctomycetes bacterium]|nr:MFS transporter [Planctomycetota bacterium]